MRSLVPRENREVKAMASTRVGTMNSKPSGMGTSLRLTRMYVLRWKSLELMS